MKKQNVYGLVLVMIVALGLFVGCQEFGPDQTIYQASFTLDMDGDGLAHYPFGPDMDDDDDGYLTRLAGGRDVDDQNPKIKTTGKGNGHFSTVHYSSLLWWNRGRS